MVTTKPSVQRLCGGDEKEERTARERMRRRESRVLCKIRRGKKKEERIKVRAEIMCSTIISVSLVFMT